MIVSRGAHPKEIGVVNNYDALLLANKFELHIIVCGPQSGRD